jgi:GNAT superfamily N-acetyltransferase
MEKLVIFILVICADLSAIEVSNEPPQAEEFVALRIAAGMRGRAIASAQKGIENSLFWITLRNDDKLVGMGRVIGDGGTVVQIVDVVVHPEHQGKGYGKLIINAIQEYILAHVPDDAFVCLFAEHEVVPFYEKKGFQLSEEKWPGMYWPCVERVAVKKVRQ